MITREVFFKQRDKKRAEFKKQKLETYPNYNIFYYLVKQRPNSFGKAHRYVELKTFSWHKSGYNERKFYLQHKLSDYKEKGLNKLYPVLEEVKFKDMVLYLPVGGIDELYQLECIFSPSGIVIEKLTDSVKKIETTLGVHNTKKIKLMIPEKYFKDVKKRK